MMPKYRVGYSRPPQHTRFCKGQSGNPRGRPRQSKNLLSIARKALNEKIVIKENGRRRVITKFEAVIKQLVNKAAFGDVAAIRELLKVEATLSLTDAAEEEKLTVNIVRFAWDENQDDAGRPLSAPADEAPGKTAAGLVR
jgi:hypothetical protein